MTEAKRWSACRNGKCNCGYVHRDGVFALKVVGEGDHVDPYLPETERQDLIRRVTALLNAAEGISTETLESGVVVPVEIAEIAMKACDIQAEECQKRGESSAEYENAAGVLFGRCSDALSRLQQNGEPTETRITVTIDLQTYRGYRDRRVIEVEPGIGWADRLVPEVERVAQEMEERCLGLVRRDGGEGQ